MKVNDFVLVKGKEIGIITKIVEHKIYVSFNFYDREIYNDTDARISILSNDLINYIIDTYDQNIEYKMKNLIDVYKLNIMSITYNDNILLVKLDERSQPKIKINYLTKEITCDCHLGKYCNHKNIVLLYLKEQLTILKNVTIDEKTNIDDLMQLTSEFVNNFFNMDLFHQLCDKIAKKNLVELWTYAQKIHDISLDNDYKIYLLLMIANNTNYLTNLCSIFNVVNGLIKNVLMWALLRSNYSNENNYAQNMSIKYLKENKAVEWVKLMNAKGLLARITNKYDINRYILKEIARTTSNITELWDIDADLNYYYIVDEYQNLLFSFTTIENKKILLDNNYVTTITEDAIDDLDVTMCIDYYYLMKYNVRKKVINTYFKELTTINPKIILDMLIMPNVWLKIEDKKIFTQVLPYISDNKYLKEFIAMGFKNQRFLSLDQELSKYKKN